MTKKKKLPERRGRPKIEIVIYVPTLANLVGKQNLMQLYTQECYRIAARLVRERISLADKCLKDKAFRMEVRRLKAVAEELQTPFILPDLCPFYYV